MSSMTLSQQQQKMKEFERQLQRVDQLEQTIKKSKASSIHEKPTSGPATTIGLVLDGITIRFLIPGGPAYVEDTLEPSDQIVAVDGIRANEQNLQSLILGCDIAGSLVRLTAKKADGGNQFDVSLRRQSVTYMNTYQIYSELFEQLNSISKRDKDMQNLVRRIGLKVQDIVKFQSAQLDDLRYYVEIQESCVDELIRMIRMSLQEQQRQEGSPETNPIKGSTHSSVERHSPGTETVIDPAAAKLGQFKNENLESEIRRLSTLISKSNIVPMSNSEEEDVTVLKQRLRDINKELNAHAHALEEAQQRENRTDTQLQELTRKLELKQQELSQHQADLFRLQRISGLDSSVQLLQEQLKRSESELQKTVGKNAECEATLATCMQRLQSVAHAAQHTESALRDDLTNLNGELRAIQARLVLKVADCDRLEKMEVSMKTTIKELEHQLEIANQKKDEAERNYGYRQKTAEEEIRALSAKLRQNLILLEDALAAESRLKIVASEAHTIAESMHERKAKAEQEYTERIHGLEEELRKALAKEAENRELVHESAIREHDLNRRLQQVQDDSRTTLTKMRSLQSELDESRARASELQQKVSNLEARVIDAERQRDFSSVSLQRKNEELTAKLNTSNDKISALETGLADLGAFSQQKTEQVQNLQRRVASLEQECIAREQDAEKQRNEFEATAHAREWQLQALQERLKVAEERNERCTKREEQILETLDKAQAELTQLHCSSMEVDLKSKKEIGTLNLKLKALCDEIEHVRQDKSALETLLHMPAGQLAAQSVNPNSALNRSVQAFRRLGAEKRNLTPLRDVSNSVTEPKPTNERGDQREGLERSSPIRDRPSYDKEVAAERRQQSTFEAQGASELSPRPDFDKLSTSRTSMERSIRAEENNPLLLTNLSRREEEFQSAFSNLKSRIRDVENDLLAMRTPKDNSEASAQRKAPGRQQPERPDMSVSGASRSLAARAAPSPSQAESPTGISPYAKQILSSLTSAGYSSLLAAAGGGMGLTPEVSVRPIVMPSRDRVAGAPGCDPAYLC